MITRACLSDPDGQPHSVQLNKPSALTELVRLLSTYYILEGEPLVTSVSIVSDGGDDVLVCTFTGTVFEMRELFEFARRFREFSESSNVVVGVVTGKTKFGHRTDVMDNRSGISRAALISLLPVDDYSDFGRADLIDRYLAV